MADPDSNIQQINSESTPTSPAMHTPEFDVYHIRRVVAGNPNTPQRVLERLAQDQAPAIRRRTAENPHAPVELLLKLAHDDHADVRLAVAENPNTPPEVLSVLGEDEDADVRYGVAENSHMPEDILLKLSEDENPYVRCRALKTLETMAPEIQTRLRMFLQPGYKNSLGYKKS